MISFRNGALLAKSGANMAYLQGQAFFMGGEYLPAVGGCMRFAEVLLKLSAFAGVFFQCGGAAA
jgi:hypothetical protein